MSAAKVDRSVHVWFGSTLKVGDRTSWGLQTAEQVRWKGGVRERQCVEQEGQECHICERQLPNDPNRPSWVRTGSAEKRYSFRITTGMELWLP